MLDQPLVKSFVVSHCHVTSERLGETNRNRGKRIAYLLTYSPTRPSLFRRFTSQLATRAERGIFVRRQSEDESDH